MRYTLGKQSKLCSDTAIDLLFRGGDDVEAAIAYPLRAVWRSNSQRRDQSREVKMLISIPKRRIRRAVDRVTLRRRTREAFRLNFRKYPLADDAIDLAFIYIANSVTDYAHIEHAMKRLLGKVAPIAPTPAD